MKRAGILLAFAASFWAVCLPATPTAAQPVDVVIVGDSITYMSGATVQDALPDETIVGRVGYTAAELRPSLLDELASQPDVVILEDGANDAMRRVIHWRAEEQTSISDVRRLPCVVLVTVPRAADRNGGRVAEQWNAGLRAAVNTHPRRFRLVDYDDAIASSPIALTIDGIHPNEAGSAWLSDAYTHAIASC
jgi:lysophospholipase L1-like esterase